MSFEYERESIEYGPIPHSSTLQEALSILGWNSMLAPLRGILGSAISPSWTFQGDERTGWYFIDIGVWGFSAFGFPSLELSSGYFKLLNTFGKSIQIDLPTTITVNRTQTLQDKDGTIALLSDVGGTTDALKVNGEGSTIVTGQPVYFSSGTDVMLAKGDGLAHEAKGVVEIDIASSESGKIILLGIISRDDWTDVVGATDLTANTDYYLDPDNAGQLTSSDLSNGAHGTLCQRIGIALDARKFFVMIQPAIVV